MQNLESNIWKYGVLLVTNKRIFVAILGAYYLTIPEVTPWWIGMFIVFASIAGFIFEIPSGYVSDKIGHKTALIISRVVMLFSTSFFLFAESIPLLILGGICLSISNTFLSGTGSAFMHETMRGLNREKDYTKVMGKLSSIGFAVPVVLTALVPFFVDISYKVPFLIMLILDIIGLTVTLMLVRPPVTPEHIEEVGLTNFKQVLREAYRLNFFRYAIFTGTIVGVLMVAGTFRAPYQTVLLIPVVWFGVLHGIGRVLASIILAYSGNIKEWVGDIHRFYRYQLMVYAILFLLLGAFSNIWVVVSVFIFLNALQWGMSRVSEGFLLEIIKTSKFKATLLSVGSQIDELVTIGTALGLGFVIQHSSYQFGYLCLGIGFVLFLTPLYLYIHTQRLRV